MALRNGRGRKSAQAAQRQTGLPLDDPATIDAALRAAVRQLESAVVEQERAVNRILGLTELLMQHSANSQNRLRVEAIMESCAFQDITGQRIRKVKALLRRLTTLPPGVVRATDPATDTASKRSETEVSSGEPGLSQEEVDRLLGKKR